MPTVYRDGVAYTDGAMHVTVSSGSTVPSPVVTGALTLGDGTASSINLATNLSGANDPLVVFANNTITFNPAGSGVTHYHSNAFTHHGSGIVVGWSSASAASGTSDTSISRVSAGLVGVGTGGAAEVDGAIRAAYYATSVPVTETGTTHTVAATTSHLITNQAAAVTVTLPAAASFPGRQIYIRAITNGTVVSATTNVVPRAGGAAGTAIIGAVDGGWVLLVSDGTAWETMAGS